VDAGRPGAAAVSGGAFADTIEQAEKHQQQAIAFDDHAFIKVARLHHHTAPPLPALAVIVSDDDKSETVCLVDCGVGDVLVVPQRDGQHPFAGAYHGRFVYHNAVISAARLYPLRGGGVASLAGGVPQTETAVALALALRPEEPKAAARVVPKNGVEGAHVAGRVDDEERVARGGAVIFAAGENDVVLGAFVRAAAVPGGEEATVGCDIDGGDAMPCAGCGGVCGAGIEVDGRWGHGRFEGHGSLSLL